MIVICRSQEDRFTFVFTLLLQQKLSGGETALIRPIPPSILKMPGRISA